MPEPLPPVDENVKVPRGVLASSAKAEQIHAAAYGPTPPAAATNLEATKPQPTHPNQSATPPAAAAPPPAPQPSPVPPETADDWKQRYNSLKGRFDQQAGESANMRARLASLENLVSTMQRPPPQETPPPAPRAQTKRVTDAEMTEYGEDMIKMVQKAALDAVEPLIDQRVSTVRTEVQNDLRQTKTQLGTVERESAINAHQRLLDYLDRHSAHWRALNRHPRFHAWLALTEPLSGSIRKTLLDNAVQRGDAARAATFYDRFLAEEGTPVPASDQTTQPPPPNGNGNGAGRVDLAALAAPGRPAASGAAPAVPDTKEIITRAQISAFYADKRRGKYSPEEVTRLEAEIFNAGNEGRIR